MIDWRRALIAGAIAGVGALAVILVMQQFSIGRLFTEIEKYLRSRDEFERYLRERRELNGGADEA